MKDFFQKLKKSDAAIPVIVGIAAVLVIGGIITAVALSVTGKNNASTPAGSTISLDFNFSSSNAGSQSSQNQNKQNSSDGSASKSGAAVSGGGADNAASSAKSGQNAHKGSEPSDSVKKPAGTLEKIGNNDRKGLAKRNAARAEYLSDVFCRDYYDDTNQNLLDQYPLKSNAKISSAWGFGALQSMQTVITKMQKNQKQLDRLKKINQGLEYYGYKKNGSFWGYVVNKGSIPMGATDPALAYDDNMWIAINLLRSYELTGQKSYLSRAKQIADMLINEAWFEPLGGFFWDTRHEARHSCSNNPAIKMLVDLYKHTKSKKYLTWAEKVFDFSYGKLKNKELNIYEDLIGASQSANGTWVEGSSAGTGFYSYNTGTMISGAAALYGATGDQKYLNEALSCAAGAMAHFGDKTVKSGYTSFASSSNIWFNAILLRGYIDLYPYAKKQTAPYIEEFQKSIDYGYEYFNADDRGYIPYNWLEGWDGSDRSSYRETLDMSANAEMYGMLAIWQKQRND